MAYANQYAHFLQSHSPLDSSKRAAYRDGEDRASAVDPAVLDHKTVMSPPNSHFRKDSFAHSNGVLSPADSAGWENHYGHGLAVEPASAGASNPFPLDNNGFVRPAASQQAAYLQHPPTWYDHGSGTNTPTHGYEFLPPLPPGADGHAPVHSNGLPEIPHGFGIASFHGEPGTYDAALQVQTPMSPHSHQDWMGMAQQEMDARPQLKRMRPSSPSRTYSDFQRRDGIRKKNGRIEIPQERNIHTIDTILATSTNDEEIKELKAQKRLLRNREAALASRQRKKKHTEDLEVKEKSYTQQISALEEQLDAVRLYTDNEIHQLVQELHAARRHIDIVEQEKRQTGIQHAQETSILRSQINEYRDQMDAGPAPAMSAVPSSTGFADFNSEMEALSMGQHDWDGFACIDAFPSNAGDDFPFEPEPLSQSPVLEKLPAPAPKVLVPAAKPSEAPTDPPIASGLLFMLLLCGAFVASRSATSTSTNLPRVPDEVRAAAPAVLNNLLSEGGSPTKRSQQQQQSSIVGYEPVPSGLPHNAAGSNSRLDRMHQQLTAPTRQQEIDQAFALTPAQYASMTGADMPVQADLPPPRRNLAEALANVQQRDADKGNVAAVYTRSLLWDQIPADVVKQFKQMVKDTDEIEVRSKQQGPPTMTQQQARRSSQPLHSASRNNDFDDVFGYKVEP